MKVTLMLKLTEAVGVVIIARCAVSALSASKVAPAGALARHRVTPGQINCDNVR